MKIWIFLLLLLTQSATYAATVLSQGARNVKNGAPYGGASAVGDGVHDDTQAFLDAFNAGRNLSASGDGVTNVSVYVPPGNYLVSKQLIPWGPCVFFGEPSAPPTIYLKANTITSSNIPPDGNGTNLPLSFICVRWATFQAPYSTNWNCNTGVNYPSNPPNPSPGRSNNNCFSDFIHDINFTVLSGNTGVKAVLEWSCAQGTALRNVVLTGTSQQTYALWTRPGANGDNYGSGQNTGEAGGGGIIHNVTCNGVGIATMQDSVFERTMRGCTFNGAFISQGGNNVMSLICCTFNNPGGQGCAINNNPLLTMDDCVFTSGTPFTNGGGSNLHMENCTFGSANANPSFPTGVLPQYTSGSVLYNQQSISGTDARLNSNTVVRGSPFYNPPYPFPNSTAVSIMSFGGNTSGGSNDTALTNAFASGATDVYFPPGTYTFNSTINLSPSGSTPRRLFGNGSGSTIVGAANPVISVTGRGIGPVGLISLNIARTGGSGPDINWNGDQTSVMMDVGLGSTINYPGPFVNFVSGGCFFEAGETNTGNANSVTQFFNITSSDPLYMVAIDPQHSAGTPIVMTNAQNVIIREMTYEMLRSGAMTNAMTITGGQNINIGALCLADRSGGTAATYGVNISGASVSLWETSMNAYGTAIIHDGTTNVGTGSNGNFQVVGGYVDFTGSALSIPSVTVSAATMGLTTATLHGSITSNGSQTITSDGFDWGTTTAYGNSLPASTVQSGSLTANLTGLTTGQIYHGRAKAVNSSGTGYSGDNTFTATSTSTPPPNNNGPYKGTAAPVPGIVYASNYDLGGPGVGYQDSQNGNPNVYRTDGVDLKLTSDTTAAGTGYVLGWRTAGEWTKYTVNAQAGKYALSARVESAFNTGKFHVAIDGSTVIAPVSIPLTGPWDIASSWKTVNLGTVTLTAGSHVVTVLVDAAWFDLNYLSFVSTATPVKYIQSAYAAPQTSQQTVPVTYAAAQTSGNLNVVIVGWNDTTSVVSSVKDSKGNVYQLAVGPTLLTGNLSQSIYYTSNILAASAGANAVTVTFSKPATYADIRILEYSGISQTSPVDSFASAVGNSTTSSSGNLTTTSATDLLIGANIVQQGTVGAGTGFTQRLLTSDGDIVEDKVVTSVGTYSASTALSGPSAGWDMQMVAFRAASQ